MRQSHRRRWLMTGVGVAAAAALALTVGSHGKRDIVYDAQPESIAHGKESYYFTSVDSLTATSHLVVYGTVSAVGQGRFTGADEDGTTDSQIRLRNVTITVDQVLHNPKKMAFPATVTLEEEGWDAQGAGYIANGVAWSQVGDTGFFFLRRASGSYNWVLTSSEGRALNTNGVLAPSNADGELATLITRTPPDFFGEKIYMASQAFAGGTLQESPSIDQLPASEEGPGA